MLHYGKTGLIALVAAAAFMLSACTGLSSLLAPSAQPLEQAAVAAAVATAVGVNKSIAEQTARARVIKNIAQMVLDLDTGTNVALFDVEAAINAKVLSLKLPPQDVLLAQLLTQAFTGAVAAELQTKTNGVISPNTQVAIANVAKWVIADTSAYGV